MKVKKAKFIVSAEKLSRCPDFCKPEIALIGRSNVGKSSFINALTNNNKLAKTSNKPGKTRLINLFEFDEKYIVADLPGYGYAQVSKAMQDSWQKNLEEYLLNRDALKLLIQFVDARHDIQKNDMQMHEWIEYHGLPSVVVATKVDLISKSSVFTKVKNFEKVLNKTVFPFSGKDSFYNEKIIKYIEETVL